MQNPFNISFGKKPTQFISRLSGTEEITTQFMANEPSTQMLIITGVRGSGKTVMMTTASHRFEEEKDWIVVELNVERDLLQSLAAKLYRRPELHNHFVKAKLNLSVFGRGGELANEPPISDIEDASEAMVKQVKRVKKRVLVCIDEATNSQNVKVFASAFLILVRQDLPIFALMTGLHENVYNLQNEKSLTFLYRAPKIQMGPLDYTSIENSYKSVFSYSDKIISEMTKITKGYPFAFQALGYICWNTGEVKKLSSIIPEYDHYLNEFVYTKVWSELSSVDKIVCTAISNSKRKKVKETRELMAMDSGLFSVYRDRLKRKGIIDISEYGKIDFALPRFDVFVKQHVAESEYE